MTSHAILRAVADEPHDDGHRLVFADWLDDHGGPAEAARAEFIRVQIERERLPTGDPRRGELRRREIELLDVHRAAWQAELPKLQGVVWHHFWRGFVGGADVQAWKFYRRHAVAMFAAAPVQFLRVFSISTGTCRELAASPYLARLVSLALIDSHIGDEGVAALAASPWLCNLQQLHLCGGLQTCFRTRAPGGVIRDVGAQALAASASLGRLVVLDLRFNVIGPEAVDALRQRFGTAVRL